MIPLKDVPDFPYTADAMVCRAVRIARPRYGEPGPKWGAVSDTFACGATVAKMLCRWAEVDPDEEVS